MRAVIIYVFMTVVMMPGIRWAATEGIVAEPDGLEVHAYHVNDDYLVMGDSTFEDSTDHTFLCSTKQMIYYCDFLLSGRDSITTVTVT